jgi:hypothetical protein
MQRICCHIVREQLIQFVGSASSESVVRWTKLLNAKTDALLAEASDDPLSRMYAEVAVLAWFDYARSSLMPYLTGDDMRRSQHWGAAMTRWERRWGAN